MDKTNRKILVTNDDGIEADGLVRLVREAVNFGEVWVVAPDGQRSAVSHGITLYRPIDLYPWDMGIEGVRAFKCNGTPCDCVRVGSLGLMPYKPDIVLAGINYGYNTATDLQYSATAAAAFEAAFQGCPGISLSEGRKGHEVTDLYLHEILAEVIDEKCRGNRIVNINFPDCSADQYKGILRDRKVSGSTLFRDGYALAEKLPDNGMRFVLDAEFTESAEEGTDLRAVLDGYISIGLATNIS